jgi:hypothetical protein
MTPLHWHHIHHWPFTGSLINPIVPHQFRQFQGHCLYVMLIPLVRDSIVFVDTIVFKVLRMEDIIYNIEILP